MSLFHSENYTLDNFGILSVREWPEVALQRYFDNDTSKRYFFLVLTDCLRDLVCIVVIPRFYKVVKSCCFSSLEKDGSTIRDKNIPTPTEIKTELDTILGESVLSFITEKTLAADFKGDRLSIQGAERSERPKSAATEQVVQKVHRTL